MRFPAFLAAGLAFFLCVSFPAPGQNMFWESPEALVKSESRFPQAASGGGFMALVWQEPVESGENRGVNYLSIKTSRDGKTWVTHERFAGPYPFFAAPNSIFSLTMDPQGVIFVAVLSGAASMDFFVSRDAGRTFRQTSLERLPITTLAPRLFYTEEENLLLFITQELAGALSIFSAVSEDGLSWSEFAPLVPEPELTLSFLPQHTSFEGREYVVFQAVRLREGGGYQLHLKTSDDGGRTWGPVRLLTNFGEVVDGVNQRAESFDNERPHIAVVGEGLAVAWERRYGRRLKQVYYMEIDGEGALRRSAEQVTRGMRPSSFPQIVLQGEMLHLVWFDGRPGEEHIILASRRGIFWEQKDLSVSLRGVSIFGRPVMNGGDLSVFWENRQGEDSRIFFLQRDTSAPAPVLAASNFTAGKRSGENAARLQWTQPEDSSGILGFAYQWTRSPRPSLPHVIMIPESQRSIEVTADADGPWYFHIAAQDKAGNWSPAASIEYYRDTTPPGKIVFREPEQDELGFLVSNSFTLNWLPPDEPVAGYTYNFQYAGEERDPDYEKEFSSPYLPQASLLQEPELSFENNDNGAWSLSVAAIDEVGNVGLPETIFVYLNKYRPVTYISLVNDTKDEIGQIFLTIWGRGFSEDGEVSDILIDKDGAEPWDYVFRRSSGEFTVDSDRIISDFHVHNIQNGDYLIGVRHPLRGVVFAQNSLHLEMSGLIKFGDFTSRYEPGWKALRGAPLLVRSEAVLLWVLVAFFACAMLFSAYRLAALVREGQRLRGEALALASGDDEHWRKKQERISGMRKRGIGLRLKFALFITVLVISVVLMVALPLAAYMSGNEERNLAEGLYQRSAVLLESLATGSRSYLPGANLLELNLLPAQISAMEEALFATISGRSQRDIAAYGYVWASNDPNIKEKIDTGEMAPGVSRMQDDIFTLEAQIAEEINLQARTALAGIAAEIGKLTEEGRSLALRTDAASQNRLQDIQTSVRTLESRVNEQLSSLAQAIGSSPPFRVERRDYSGEPWYKRLLFTLKDVMGSPRIFDENTLEYTFYKPILYRTSGVDVYYRGLVRLGVSTENILSQLEDSRRILITITSGVALVALIIGIGGALVLASITVIPINRLMRGVERIRDTEDKEELKNYTIDVKTRDEIFDLAEAINQMTRGLARAAAASKDLTVGKEIQKMFIPLEIGPGGKKLTVGKVETGGAEFFGYYEGAKGVSGDYFEYRQLDADNYAFIKCDVSGKGVPAALIMVQVATVFISYFKDHDSDAGKISMVPLLYRINDIVESLGFKGRFAAMTLGILNIKTGVSRITHAGDRVLNIYDAASKEFSPRLMNDSPATGVFPNFMVETRSPFEQIQLRMNPGDINMLFTDGVEESHRKLRKPNFDIMQLPPDREGDEPIEDEMLGNERIKAIFEAAMNKGKFRMEKAHNPVTGEELVFDFAACEPTAESAVKALVSVEKIWRTYPHPRANANNRVMVDKVVDEFLKKTFSLYARYYSHPMENPNPDEYPNYNFYTHLMEDDQYDDLTLLAIRKK